MRFSNVKIEVEGDIAKKIPFNFKKNIEAMLKVIPPEHILHLGKIRVTSLSPERKQKQAYGLYYGKREGFELPTIVICADSLLKGIPRIIFCIMPFIPRLLLADTLYHEIAHHYQRVSRGYKKERWEKDAEQYSKEMRKKLFLSSGVFKLVYSLRFVVVPVLKILKNKGFSFCGRKNKGRGGIRENNI
jgi:hypothetical protein